jgi:hypothetical protein
LGSLDSFRYAGYSDKPEIEGHSCDTCALLPHIGTEFKLEICTYTSAPVLRWPTAFVGGWRSYNPMLYCDATPLPQEVTIDLLTNWLCLRDVVRLDSAVCASALRRQLYQCFHTEECTFPWSHIETYEPGYIEWCISRRVYVGGVCLRCDNVVGNAQAHKFLHRCGEHLRFCKLIGDQSGVHGSFDIPYEVLTISEEICGLMMVKSQVNMCTLKRALGKGLCALKFTECCFQDDDRTGVTINCANLSELSFVESTNVPEHLIASVVERSPNLRDLNVSSTGITSDAILTVAGLRLSQLERLYAVNFPATDASMLAVARGCHLLQEVVMGDLDSTVSDRSVIELVRNCPDLQVLWLDRLPGISAALLEEICACKLLLRALGIVRMWGVTNELIRRVVDCCPGLTDLSLPCTCSVQWFTLKYIAVNCCNLRYIQFSGTTAPYPGSPKRLFENGVEVSQMM